MKNMDKMLIGLGLFVVIVGLFIYTSKATECVLPEGKGGINDITYKDYECLLKDSAIDLVYVGSAYCGYCTQYYPILQSVTEEYQIPAYYLDISTISEISYNKLGKSNNYFISESKWGTPTTLIMKGNEVVDVLGGLVTEEQLIEFLKNNELISEQ